MQVRAERDAVVFFLNHQKNHGLVRLSRHQCRQRADARVVRANESLQMPLPINAHAQDDVSAVHDWSRTPDGDTFYALAVSNSEAAHVISRHLQQLPLRCSPAVRFGLRDEKLDEWMAELATLVSQWRDDVDWQALQVRNVY